MRQLCWVQWGWDGGRLTFHFISGEDMLCEVGDVLVSLFCLGSGYRYLHIWTVFWGLGFICPCVSWSEAGPCFQLWKLGRPAAYTSQCQQPGCEPVTYPLKLLPRTLNLEPLMQNSWSSLELNRQRGNQCPRLATRDPAFLWHDLGRGPSARLPLAPSRVSEPGFCGFSELPDSLARNSFFAYIAWVGFFCS